MIVKSPHEMAELYNFLIVRLAPEYEGIETNIGIELLLKAIAKASGISKKIVKESFLEKGDLGLVCQEVLSATKIKVNVTFAEVFESFREISQTNGLDAVARKEKVVAGLLGKASPEEAKYIVRWLVGNLKTGAGDKTIMTALAKAIVLNPPKSKSTVMLDEN